MRQRTELSQRTDDLTEALEQQTATSEVLRVISSSPGELEPVFQAMLANAMRICEANFGVMFSYADGAFRGLSWLGIAPAFAEFLREPRVWGPETGLGRVVITKNAVHVTDTLTGRAYVDADPERMASINLGGVRTAVIVPMVKEGELVGAFSIFRQEMRPFTDKQIELVKNFAAQAVIAIENTRLLNELRQRTDDLTELLEQQTAISDILSVISNSPSDVKPVFETVARHAARICEAQIVDIITAEEGKIVVAATFGELGRPIGEALPLDRTSVMGRSIVDKQAVAVADLSKAGDEFPLGQQLALKYGHRSILAVPLLREGRALGTILVRRTEVRPFEDKHITLLKTFADQAAIAIENARLLNELRQRTDDLTEALEQQTATSEVLRVISSSPGELEPVFNAMLENATRICDAKFGTLFRYDGELFHRVAGVGTPPALVEFQRQLGPFKYAGSLLGRVARTKMVGHSADELADPDPGPSATHGGARSVVGVPMLKDNELVGAIVIYRQEVRPFSDKQIELVQNFAAQAVIAIENTRLLSELRQSLQQQTATADVLKTISRSTFDLQSVLDTLTRSAATLCEAETAGITRQKDNAYYYAATYGYPPDVDQYLRSVTHHADPGVLWAARS